jgi:hypothetical protein
VCASGTQYDPGSNVVVMHMDYQIRWNLVSQQLAPAP